MIDAAEITADQTRLDNMNRILDAAEKLFRHYGYTKTNVADIAKELGMSPANVYRFFKSKADIHEALAKRMLSGSEQLLLQIARSGGSAEERLRTYVLSQHALTRETMMDEEKVHEMVVIAMEQQWSVIEGHIERVRTVLEKIIAEGVANGEFRPLDAASASKCFASATVALCHPQIVAQCPARNNRATPEELIEFVMTALRA